MSSVATQYDVYYPSAKPKVKSRQLNKNHYKTKVKTHSNINSMSTTKLGIIIMSVFVVMLSFVILSGYDKITTVRNEINTIEREISALTEDKQILDAKIEMMKNRKKIEEDALYKLGMVHPSTNQIMRVSVNSIQEEQVAQNKFGLADFKISKLILGK